MDKRRRTVVVLGIDIGFVCQQQLRQVLVAPFTAWCKGVLPISSLVLRSAPLARTNSTMSVWPSDAAMNKGVLPNPPLALTSVGEQHFCQVLVAQLRRFVQGSKVGVVPGIDIGFVGEQQFRHVRPGFIAIKRVVQRRPAVIVLALTSAPLASSSSASFLWPLRAA